MARIISKARAHSYDNAIRFPHGVSVKWVKRISGTDRKEKPAPVEVVYGAFTVLKTGRKSDHFTVVLPEPVTEEDVIKFNTIFVPKTSETGDTQ